jgi:hypothetical protein
MIITYTSNLPFVVVFDGIELIIPGTVTSVIQKEKKKNG